jgi:enoyl-CoA hydratase/carnithine racemase
MSYQTLEFSVQHGVADVVINRPNRANAIDSLTWNEIRRVFIEIDRDSSIRVATLRGGGAHFSAGIDIELLASLKAEKSNNQACSGRAREKLRDCILDLQDTVSMIERCRKPVLAMIRGACYGAGVDLICACDMRYCSEDARFCVKEVDMGVTADLGTLQRLPRLVGDGMARELVYTARVFAGREGEAIRLVNRCFASSEDMFAAVDEIASLIARKSPLAIRGSKQMLVYARDHSVSDSLAHVAALNAAILQSQDLEEALSAFSGKRNPVFPD